MVLKWIMRFVCAAVETALGLLYRGSEVLPPPLSPEEEQATVEACQAGDEQARNKLIEHNLRLVVFLARKFESAAVSTEDLISIGTIGLIKAVGTYRSDKNVKLATYASRCIENEILMHLRKLAGRRTEVSFDERYPRIGTEMSCCSAISSARSRTASCGQSRTMSIACWCITRWNGCPRASGRSFRCALD